MDQFAILFRERFTGPGIERCQAAPPIKKLTPPVRAPVGGYLIRAAFAI